MMAYNLAVCVTYYFTRWLAASIWGGICAASIFKMYVCVCVFGMQSSENCHG